MINSARQLVCQSAACSLSDRYHQTNLLTLLGTSHQAGGTCRVFLYYVGGLITARK